MSTNYEKAVQLIKNRSDLINFYGECSDLIIQKAEILLGLKFPKDYREHLKNFGGIDFRSRNLCGLGDDITHSEMIKWTLESRNKWHMPQNLIIIEDTGWDGEMYCLQINENDPDKSPVVIYVHPTVPIEIIAPDFGTFLLELVEQEIKFAEEERKLQENA